MAMLDGWRGSKWGRKEDLACTHSLTQCDLTLRLGLADPTWIRLIIADSTPSIAEQHNLFPGPSSLVRSDDAYRAPLSRGRNSRRTSSSSRV